MMIHSRRATFVVLSVILLTMLGGLSSSGQVPQSPAGAAGCLLPPISMERGDRAPTYVGCGGETAPPINSGYEQQIVELVNAVRADHGLPPYKRVTGLDQAARYHATDLGQDDYFEHDSYDRAGGSLVWVCDWSARTGTYYAGWSSMAENIAGGYSSPQAAMDAWMNSTGHRNNILSTGNWEIGVGYFQGEGSYFRYWVQDFGRRSGIYPLVINGDAATTDTRNVTLHIYGDWQEIRLRNDDGAWTDWQPFQSTQSWTLNEGTGLHTVQAEMRSNGQTASTSDTIYLITGEDPLRTFLPLVEKDRSAYDASSSLKP